MYHVSIELQKHEWKFRKMRIRLWEHVSRRQVFLQLFRVLLNFRKCFYISTETRRTCFPFLLENTVMRKRKNLLGLIIKM